MITLAIPDMTCGHCKASVEAAIHNLDAVAKVEVDLTTRTASIDSSATPTAIIAALDSIGFNAIPA